MSADGPRERTIDRWILALLLAAALALRAVDIESFFVGPDEGMYLYSARVHELERSLDPIRGVREDVAWARELAAKYADEVETYQHSYLHQLAARWLYRAGLRSLAALRTSSLLCGVLTVAIAWGIWSRFFPGRRFARFAVAAALAFHPLLVFYARTGWGQIGFTCFYLAYLGVLHRVLTRIEEHDRRAFFRAGLCLLAMSVLAFGWQENVAPYVVGSGVVVVLAPLFTDAPGAPRGYFAPLVSRRTWTYVWSAAPVGAATLALKLWSPFAQAKWFNAAGRAGLDSWSELKKATLENLVVAQRLDLVLGWAVVALAPVGLVALWRRERAFALHLSIATGAGSLLLFLLFGDAWLLRAHMPLWLVIVVLAAEGAVAIGARFRSALARAAPLALMLASFVVLSCATLFGRVESPLFLGHLYAQGERANVDHRRPDEALIDWLRAHRTPDQRVAVYYDKGPIFRLLDAGIEAREFTFPGKPRDAWPHWILGVERLFVLHGHTIEQGGAYRLVERDTIGRHALYEIADGQ